MAGRDAGTLVDQESARSGSRRSANGDRRPRTRLPEGWPQRHRPSSLARTASLFEDRCQLSHGIGTPERGNATIDHAAARSPATNCPPKGQLICPHAQCGCRALGQRWQPAPTPRAERARADAVELPPLMKPRWGSKGTTSSAVTLCRLGLYLRRDVGEERASKADNYDRYGDQDEGVPIA